MKKASFFGIQIKLFYEQSFLLLFISRNWDRSVLLPI